MAANYWESTQRKHWQFTKDELAKIRQDLEDEDPALVSMYPLPQSRHINIYINQRMSIAEESPRRRSMILTNIQKSSA